MLSVTPAKMSFVYQHVAPHIQYICVSMVGIIAWQSSSEPFTLKISEYISMWIFNYINIYVCVCIST